ncbi:MAG: DUF3572 domain-containing protein [Phyllobacteriaceae bacterium]|nr:DUF3572 domain-containing protein [Phyllobacteriaceae bacterium]
MPSPEDAETLAIRALTFVAADTTLFTRFLALSGIEAAQIRRAASEPGFLAGVLAFIAAHEPTLMAFAADAGIDPATVTRALARLPAGDQAWDVQT